MTFRLVEYVGDGTFLVGDYLSEPLAVLAYADTAVADDSEHDLTIHADAEPIGRRTRTLEGA